MHIKRNIAVAATSVFLVVLVLVAMYLYTSYRIDTTSMEYIRQFQKGAFNFIDLANDIDVHSIDDIGYEVKGDYNLLIHYGKQVIKVNKRCLMSDDFKAKAAAIGLKILTHEDEDGNVLYKITCWDLPCTEWSRID